MGHKVIAHDAIFGSQTDDDTWLAHCGKNGWVILTKDRAIWRHPTEIADFATIGAPHSC